MCSVGIFVLSQTKIHLKKVFCNKTKSHFNKNKTENAVLNILQPTLNTHYEYITFCVEYIFRILNFTGTWYLMISEHLSISFEALCKSHLCIRTNLNTPSITYRQVFFLSGYCFCENLWCIVKLISTEWPCRQDIHLSVIELYTTDTLSTIISHMLIFNSHRFQIVNPSYHFTPPGRFPLFYVAFHPVRPWSLRITENTVELFISVIIWSTLTTADTNLITALIVDSHLRTVRCIMTLSGRASLEFCSPSFIFYYLLTQYSPLHICWCIVYIFHLPSFLEHRWIVWSPVHTLIRLQAKRFVPVTSGYLHLDVSWCGVPLMYSRA